MGSWEETCGLSHLPITVGDRALLFIIGPGRCLWDGTGGRGGFCYATGIWSPQCLPFRGKYADYGQLRLDAQPLHFKYSQDFLKADGIDLQYKKKFFTALERGQVSGTPQRDRPNPIGQVLIREDVWREALTMTYNEWNQQGSFAETLENAKEFVAYVLENLPKDLGGAFAVENHFRFREGRKSPFFWDLFESSESGTHMGMYRCRLTLDLAQGKITPEDALTILNEMGEVIHVNRIMDVLRRSWQPQSGKGSQNLAWKLHQEWSQRMVDVAAACLKAQEE